jgi:hypothetical protein
MRESTGFLYLINGANFFKKTVECTDEVWHGIPAPCRSKRKTTDGGLLQISSVHEHEHIADGRSERNMTLAYWGFNSCTLTLESEITSLVKKK